MNTLLSSANFLATGLENTRSPEWEASSAFVAFATGALDVAFSSLDPAGSGWDFGSGGPSVAEEVGAL